MTLRRRIFLVGLTLLLTLVSLLPPILAPQPVRAAGETAKQQADGAIQLSGGSLTRTELFRYWRTDQAKQVDQYSNGSASMEAGLRVKDEGGCWIGYDVELHVSLPEKTQARLVITNRDIVVLGPRGSDSPKRCSSAVRDKYHGSTYTITTTNTNVPETANQRVIRVVSNIAVEKAGQNVREAYTLKDASGATQRVQATGDNSSVGDSYIVYRTAAFRNIKPGTYTVCSDYYGQSKCQTVTKVPYTVPTVLFDTDGKVNVVRVNIDFDVSDDLYTDFTIPPFELHLLTPDKAGVISSAFTQQLDSEAIDTDTPLQVGQTFVSLWPVDMPNATPGEYVVCAPIDGEYVQDACSGVFTKGDGLYELDMRIGFEGGELLREWLLSRDNTLKKDCDGIVAGWIICPAIKGMYSLINVMFNVFATMLKTEPLSTNAPAGTTQNALYTIWNSIRIIANIGFVIMFIVAIFGQATSWVLTPYEIKKLLPRLLVAVVGVQLSWYIAGFAIDVANVLGDGLRALMLAPVRGLPGIEFGQGEGLPFSGPGFDVLASLLIGRGALGAFRLIGGAKGIIGALPLLLLPIVLFIILAVLVVILRHVLLILLVVTSPLGLLGWTLPNTSGFTKTWWNFFFKLLLMYPLIIALITAGELATRVVLAGNDTTILWQIVALVTLFSPYVLIPSTFKFAGGIIANLSTGFHKMGESLSERIFGAEGDEHGYRALQRRQRAKLRTQLFNKQMGMSINNRDAKLWVAGGGVAGNAKRLFQWRQRPGATKGWKSYLTKSGRMQDRSRGAFLPNLRGLAMRPRMYAYNRFAARSIDERFAERTKQSKEVVEALAEYNDDAIFAMFGDFSPFDGHRFDQATINSVVRYRDDSHMLTAALVYLISQAHGDPVKVQKLIDMFHKTQTGSRRKGGGEEVVWLSEDLRAGVWKGGTFPNQGIYRVLKNVDYDRRRATDLVTGQAYGRNEEHYGVLPDRKMHESIKEELNNLDERKAVESIDPTFWLFINESQKRMQGVLANRAAGKKYETKTKHPITGEPLDENGQADMLRGAVSKAKLKAKTLSKAEKEQIVDEKWQENLTELSDLREGLLDQLAGSGTLLGEEAENIVEGEGGVGHSVKWHRRDILGQWRAAEARNILSGGQQGVFIPNKDVANYLKNKANVAAIDAAILSQRQAASMDDLLDVEQASRVERILAQAFRQSTRGSFEQIKQFIEDTAWVHQKRELDKINTRNFSFTVADILR